MGMVNSVAHDLLEYRFGNRAVATPPTNYHVGLSTTTPTDTGTNFTEPAQGSYARVQIANDATTYGVAANRELSNLIIVQFPLATENWDGPLTHWGLYDQATGGTLLDWGPLTPAVTILNGQQWEFPVGQMIHRMTNVP